MTNQPAFSRHEGCAKVSLLLSLFTAFWPGAVSPVAAQAKNPLSITVNGDPTPAYTTFLNQRCRISVKPPASGAATDPGTNTDIRLGLASGSTEMTTNTGRFTTSPGGFASLTPPEAGYNVIGVDARFANGESHPTQLVVVSVLASHITTATVEHAPDGSPDTRTNIGIGESINLTFNAWPHIGALTWHSRETAGDAGKIDSIAGLWEPMYTPPFVEGRFSLSATLVLDSGRVTESLGGP